MTSHRFWRAAFPEQFEQQGSPPEASHSKAIADAMKGIDRSLGEIVEAMAPEDTILIASDHGFMAQEEPRTVWVTSFREAAASRGLIDGEGFSVQTVFGAVIVRVHPGPFEQQEALLGRLLELFASFRAEDGTPLLPVNLVDVAERPPEAVRPLGDRLRQWVTRLVVRYWFQVTIDPSAHAVMFAFPAGEALDGLWPDGQIEVAGRAAPAREAFSRDEFTGTHDPVAIFLAAGGPIVPVAGRQGLSVLDIGPLIHYLAGDRIPDDLEGSLPTHFLDPQRLAAQPPKRVPASQFSAIEVGPGAEPEASSADLTEKLRALGYVE
jgi:hypothetical protein